MRNTGPKVKISRRLGVPLTAKAARIMERRSYPPGAHGRTRQGRPAQVSDYNRQLTQKQLLKAQYGIHERQMRNYLQEATATPGNTVDNLSRLLESRLDAVMEHGGLAPTIYAARQYVTHGHVAVNGRRVTVPGYRLEPGDAVAIREGSRHLEGLADALDAANPPPYLSLDSETYSVRLERLPDRAETPVVCEFDQVIEFYSR